MAVPTYTFAQFTQNWINVFAASLGVNPNYIPGSMVLATAQADAAQAATLQLQAQYVFAYSRAQTCVGPDLDSWMAQFNFPRLPANYAQGTVTFSAGSAVVNPVYIPVGTIITTPGGAIEYQIIADVTQPGYSVTQNAYIIPSGQTTVNATAKSLLPGQAYNVQTGQLTVMQSTVFGINSVTNPSVINSGTNAETDNAYRARFIEYLGSLSKGTATALLSAVSAIQAGLKLQLLSGVQLVGNPPSSINSPYPANVVLLIDDGSGSPPTALINAAYAAMLETIALGVSFQVSKPAILSPDIVMNVVVGPNGINSVVEANVQAAIVAYVNSLPIGGLTLVVNEPGYLYLDTLIGIALNADPNVVTVEINSTTIAGEQADYEVQIYQEIVISASNVNIGTP